MCGIMLNKQRYSKVLLWNITLKNCFFGMIVTNCFWVWKCCIYPHIYHVFAITSLRFSWSYPEPSRISDIGIIYKDCVEKQYLQYSFRDLYIQADEHVVGLCTGPISHAWVFTFRDFYTVIWVLCLALDLFSEHFCGGSWSFGENMMLLCDQ